MDNLTDQSLSSGARTLYDWHNERIEQLARPAFDGNESALRELLTIYRNGDFDPGFGREIAACLGKHGLLK